MKNILIILLFSVLSFSAYSQDMVGNKMDDVKNLIREVSGIRVKSVGDSVLIVLNKQLKRSFTFKFDRASHICFQEEIRLNFSALKNITIMNQLAHSKKSTSVDISDAESIYETPEKMIFIRAEGEQVNIIFSLKKTNSKLEGASLNISHLSALLASIN